ncbi:ABC transporter ATP-binding protein [Paenibacillus chondroitinus]|uniref:ABC transporter ATP-binding protein n=1 Tax=Paenibacillus chondroitinus TaxID=59842 RepID=A0ABU6DAX0_9BACL|nr:MULTISPECIES: ABC transporter ATP-binding protein [Paenibacillus]MCY9657471.1 ABC transporter ATP-binding protein [Paenibacillus anseongense]MEB4794909.1 ABC transporter ATP-binding protein [Paenibacillus chondroitinus]
MTEEIAIQVNNVSKIYKLYDKPIDRVNESLNFIKSKKYHREFFAVNDVSFDIKKGETVGIIGKNGSGKSTLLKMITGVLTPSSGNIQINGKISALLELGAGFNPEYSGRQNIYLNASMMGLTKEEIENKVPSIIEFADIGPHIDQPVKTYSSGMFVRLAFAVAINVDPEILIVDEALAVGDDLFQKKCFSRIDAFKKSGKTVLFVSHSGNLIVELCDKAILMNDGEKLIMGPSNTVVNLYQKLLFTPKDKLNNVKEQIEKINHFGIDNNKSHTSDKKSDFEEHRGIYHLKEGLLDEQEEYFDEGLIPSNPILYENKGARIFDYKILNYKGENINVLRFGKKYVLSYKVHFYEKCQNVRFGMIIKTKTGIEISGAETAKPGNGLSSIDVNNILTIEFEFTPKLAAGVYFLRCGVVGIEDDTEIFLDRQVDAIAFRMLEHKKSLMNSLVDFDITSSIYKL